MALKSIAQLAENQITKNLEHVFLSTFRKADK